MNQNQNPFTYQDCIKSLEFAMNEIKLGRRQMNSNCKDLIILINPSAEPINLNHIRGENPEKYFVSLNSTSQIYNPPFASDVEHDLIRYYHFKNLAGTCPNVNIHIAFLIPSNKILDLQNILDYDFQRIKKPNGLILFFYDSENCLYDSSTLQQLYIDQNSNDNIVCSFLKDLNNENRIIHLTKQEIQDVDYIINLFQLIQERYKAKDLERLFQVKPACYGILCQFKEVFEEALNAEIQMVLSDIITFCSQQSIQRLQNILPGLKEFEITLRYLQIGINEKNKLIQDIDNVYTLIGAQKPNFAFDKFDKYVEIFELFREEEAIGSQLLISFQNLKFTYILDRNYIEPIQNQVKIQQQQRNSPENQYNNHSYPSQKQQTSVNQIQQLETKQQKHPYQTQYTQQPQYDSSFQDFQAQPSFKPQYNIQPQIISKTYLEQPQQTQIQKPERLGNPSQEHYLNQPIPQQQYNTSTQNLQTQFPNTYRQSKPIELHQLNLEQKYQPQQQQQQQQLQYKDPSLYQLQTQTSKPQQLVKPSQQQYQRNLEQEQHYQQPQQPQQPYQPQQPEQPQYQQQKQQKLPYVLQGLQDCQQQIKILQQKIQNNQLNYKQQEQQFEQEVQILKQLQEQQQFYLKLYAELSKPVANVESKQANH